MIKRIPEKYFIVHYPIINRKYHVSWQSNSNMIWTLKSFDYMNAVLITKTGNILKVKLSDLRETKQQALIKYERTISNLNLNVHSSCSD
jgi:hypothetical protein